MAQMLEPTDKDIKIMIAEGKTERVKQILGRYCIRKTQNF